MKQPTSNRQEESLNTLNNVDDNPNKNYPLIEREVIENTPFVLITKDGLSFIVMGEYIITEPTKTKEEALDKLNTETWLIIMHMTVIAVEKTRQYDRMPEEHSI